MQFCTPLWSRHSVQGREWTRLCKCFWKWSLMYRSWCHDIHAILVSWSCKPGKTPRGYEFLDAMMKQGLRPDSSAYFYMLAGHVVKEQLEESLELMSTMSKAGCLILGSFSELSLYGMRWKGLVWNMFGCARCLANDPVWYIWKLMKGLNKLDNWQIAA